MHAIYSKSGFLLSTGQTLMEFRGAHIHRGENTLVVTLPLREGFFWFPSTRGRRNGRAGAQKTWNRKETQRRSARRPRFFKNRQFKKTQFSPPSKRTGGLTGTKNSLPLPDRVIARDCCESSHFRAQTRGQQNI